MDWQSSADTAPAAFVTRAQARSLLGRPPASGAWREGDPVGARRFADIGELVLESGATLPGVRVAYETWGELSAARDNAVLVTHALTGDAHAAGPPGPGQPTGGWWDDLIGPGRVLDTDRFLVVCANVLGGCSGTTGPASAAPDGEPWGARFPPVTIRDQVAAQARLADALGIGSFHAVVGGSMGGMQALEWAVGMPERTRRVAVVAAPAASGADQLAANALQADAIRLDPAWADGDYYDAPDGDGPHRGLALARRLALSLYRGADELEERFGRSWQSGLDPLGGGGRWAVESYLDFHGNRFTRRFDANSYLTLLGSMSSHDVGRSRGGIPAALGSCEMPALIVGITSDRCFPLASQEALAKALPKNLLDVYPVVLDSPFGHDGFLIDTDRIGEALRRLLDS